MRKIICNFKILVGNYRFDELDENWSTKQLKDNYLKQVTNTKVTNKNTVFIKKRNSKHLTPDAGDNFTIGIATLFI